MPSQALPDNVAFIGQTLCGDGEIVAKIETVSAKRLCWFDDSRDDCPWF
jgi:hypothetical protein